MADALRQSIAAVACRSEAVFPRVPIAPAAAYGSLRSQGRRCNCSLLRLEKAVRRILRRALLGDGLLQPFDFRIHQRDAFGQLFDRQQGKILADLVGDLLPRLVVILDRHAFLLALGGPRSGCQPEPGWLIRGRLQIL